MTEEFLATILFAFFALIVLTFLAFANGFPRWHTPRRIELSGEHEVRRVPELCDVYVRLRDEDKQPGASMQRVSAAASAFAEQVRALAPAKLGEAEPRLTLDASEATDVPEEFPPSQPEKPVTGWSMQQIRSWSFERSPPRHPDPSDGTEYGKFYVAEASAKVTFHDFAELSAFVMQVSVSTAAPGGRPPGALGDTWIWYPARSA